MFDLRKKKSEIPSSLLAVWNTCTTNAKKNSSVGTIDLAERRGAPTLWINDNFMTLCR